MGPARFEANWEASRGKEHLKNKNKVMMITVIHRSHCMG